MALFGFLPLPLVEPVQNDVGVTDALTPKITETSSVLVIVAVSDTLTPKIDETAALLGIAAVSDTLLPKITEAIDLLSAIAAADTLRPKITDVAEVTALLGVSDTLTPKIDETSDLIAAGIIDKDVSDSLSVLLSEAAVVAVTAHLDVADTVNPKITETSSLSTTTIVAIAVSDALLIKITDSATIGPIDTSQAAGSVTMNEAGGFTRNSRRRRQYRRRLLSANGDASFSGPIIEGLDDIQRVPEGSALQVVSPLFSYSTSKLKILYRVHHYDENDLLVDSTAYSIDPSYTAPIVSVAGHHLLPEVRAEDRGGTQTGAIRQFVEVQGEQVFVIDSAAAPVNTAIPTLSGGTAGVITHPGTLTYVTSPAPATRWTGTFTTINHIFQRDGVDIAGATGNSYATLAGDHLKGIRVREWPDLDQGNSAFSDVIQVQVQSAPVFTGTPSLSPVGPVQEGALLTATPVVATGFPNVAETNRWFKNGVHQPAITGLTYQSQVGDFANWTFRNREDNGVGPPVDSALSNTVSLTATPPPLTAPVVTTQPTLSGGSGGVISVGTPIALAVGAATGNPVPAATRQYLNNGVIVAGQSGATYTPPAGDVGDVFTGRISWQNSVGTVLSAQTAGYTLQAAPAAGALGTPSQDMLAVAIEAALFNGDGAASNYAYHGSSLQALAIGSYVEGRGDAPNNVAAAKARLIEQIAFSLETSGNNPTMGGGFTEAENCMWSQAISVLRYAPQWNQLSQARRDRLTAVMKVALLSGAYVCSPGNHGGGSPRTLRGAHVQNLWNASPNFTLQPPAQVINAIAFFGGWTQTNAFLASLDMGDLRTELQDLGGLNELYRTCNWRQLGLGDAGWNGPSSDAPTDTQIENAVANLTYQTSGISFSNYLRLLRGITCDTGAGSRRPVFDGLIHRGRNNGAGSVGSPTGADGQPRCGRQWTGTPNPPNMGMTGGAAELYTANDGGERSTMGYGMLGVRSLLGVWISLQVAGLLNTANADVAFAAPVLDRGMKDLKHKDLTRYLNWTGSGSFRGTWPYSDSWGRHRQGTSPSGNQQGGYLFNAYFQCLEPALGL